MQDDIDWLRQEQPYLRIFPSPFNMAEGRFSFRAKYRGKCELADCYNLRITWKPYATRICDLVPIVTELDGKIERMAKNTNKPSADFHLNTDGTLCLIRPDHIREWYPILYSFRYFAKLLTSHLYWVTHFYNFGKEPWKAEEHGWKELTNIIESHEHRL